VVPVVGVDEDLVNGGNDAILLAVGKGNLVAVEVNLDVAGVDTSRAVSSSEDPRAVEAVFIFNLIITPENIFYFIYFAYSEPPQKWPLLVWSEAMNSY